MLTQPKNSSLAAFNENDELSTRLSKLLEILLNNYSLDDCINPLIPHHYSYDQSFLDHITTKISVYKTILYDKGSNFSLSSNSATAAGLELANIIFFIPYIGSALSIPIRPMLYAMDRQRKLRRTRRKFFRLIKGDNFPKIISIILSNTHQAELSNQRSTLNEARKFKEKIFREFWLCFKHQVRLDSPETEDTNKLKSFLEDFSSAAKKIYSKKNKWQMAILTTISLLTLSTIGLMFFSPITIAFLPIAFISTTQKLALAGILLIPSLHFLETAALLFFKKIVDVYETVADKIKHKQKKFSEKHAIEPSLPIDLKKFWTACLYNYHETLAPDLKQSFQESIDKILQSLEKEKTLAESPVTPAIEKNPTLFQPNHRHSRNKIAGGPAAARQKTPYRPSRSNSSGNSSPTYSPIKQPLFRHSKFKKHFHTTDLFRRPASQPIRGYLAESPFTQCFNFLGNS